MGGFHETLSLGHTKHTHACTHCVFLFCLFVDWGETLSITLGWCLFSGQHVGLVHTHKHTHTHGWPSDKPNVYTSFVAQDIDNGDEGLTHACVCTHAGCGVKPKVIFGCGLTGRAPPVGIHAVLHGV